LDDYCVKNIFAPLGIKNMSFFPSEEMKGNLAYMNRRYADGHLTTVEHLLRRSLYNNPSSQKKKKSSTLPAAASSPNPANTQKLSPRF
jgi:CubicO group peptidase (beta-lactamase class C family)